MSNTQKHTPGPWKLEKLHPGGDYIVYKAMNLPVAKVLHPEDSALIAAAPEMLAAFKALRNACWGGCACTHPSEEENAAWDLAEAAEAKAEGRQHE
jgi:hypothetical protein